MNKLLPLLLLVLVFASGCESVAKDYRDADAATYNAVAGEYLDLVNASTLSEIGKIIRRTTIKTWRMRIQKHGGEVDE